MLAEKPEQLGFERWQRHYMLKPGCGGGVLVLGRGLHSSPLLRIGILGGKKQDVASRIDYQHGAGLIPAGQVIEIRLLEKSGVEVVGFTTAKQDDDPILELFPELGASGRIRGRRRLNTLRGRAQSKS